MQRGKKSKNNETAHINRYAIKKLGKKKNKQTQR